MPIREDWFEFERLHRAAAEGDLAEMRRLVATGYALDAFDDMNQTPLHYAAEGEHYKAAEWLLDQGASVNAHDEEQIGETPLCLAVRRDYPEMVELFLRRGADPDIRGWMGLTARIRAHERKDEDGHKIACLIESYRPPQPNPGAKR
jgi:ankyrin repeat protein